MARFRRHRNREPTPAITVGMPVWIVRRRYKTRVVVFPDAYESGYLVKGGPETVLDRIDTVEEGTIAERVGKGRVKVRLQSGKEEIRLLRPSDLRGRLDQFLCFGDPR